MNTCFGFGGGSIHVLNSLPCGLPARGRRRLVAGRRRGHLSACPEDRTSVKKSDRNFVKNSAIFCSFSAVSAPTFANRYAFFGIFQIYKNI